MDLKNDKLITQADLVRYTGRKAQWFQSLIDREKLDTQIVFGRRLIVNNKKLKDYLKSISIKEGAK